MAQQEVVIGHVQSADYNLLSDRCGFHSEKKHECVIYEAAFLYDNLFVRTDILVKTDKTIKVIEVKAKSFDSTMESIFLTKTRTIKSNWKSYLFDLAFQKYVVKQLL